MFRLHSSSGLSSVTVCKQWADGIQTRGISKCFLKHVKPSYLEVRQCYSIKISVSPFGRTVKYNNSFNKLFVRSMISQSHDESYFSNKPHTLQSWECQLCPHIVIIPERFPFSNTRRILNLIYANNKPYSAVISLDAQQAFDQIEWAYMFNTLKKFGFGERFMTFIKMLNLCPKSSVLTNYDKSPPFHLHCGTRQGCCLSPMLFDLALEPLAISIRTSPEIIGIPCSSSVSTIGLYADDVALTLSDVKTSLSPLLKLIKSFGQLSGFTINWDKSILMPLSDGLDLYYLG